ncbi:MAG: hypothetical protein PVH42_08345, partial [Desulfobacterales bacterium]
YTVAAVLSFLVLNNLPLDYFRLPVEPVQSLYLLTAFLFLSLPFFIAGTIIALGYTAQPQKTGLIYFASMAGSALGAIAPAILLPLFSEGRLLVVMPLIPILPVVSNALMPSFGKNSNARHLYFGRTAVMACSFGILCFTVILLSQSMAPVIRVKPSPFKSLSQVLQFPKTKIVDTKTSIRGRIERVKTPYIRFAPGLSLKYTQTIPGQDALFTDGDNQLVLYDLNEKKDSRFASAMLSFAGYYLSGTPEKVLLLNAGGGSAVACAIAAGAGQIKIIEQNPDKADILGRQYRLPVVVESPRAFLAQTNDQYDIIHVENWGYSMVGAAALNQDHLFTLEAMDAYWGHLTATGAVIISRKLLLPPSDSLRLWSTAYESLKNNAVARPEEHLALLRNFDTYMLLVSKSKIKFQQVLEFCRRNNFDPVFLAGMQPNWANNFNVFDAPYHFQKISQLAAAMQAGRQIQFYRMYPLDIAPQSDRRPFPGRFLKWSKVKSLYQSLGSRFYVLLMSGEIVISVVFIEAMIVSISLLIIPLIFITRGNQYPHVSQVAYFSGIGAGFMLVELYFIKSFILVLGDPVISFTLVISAILIFSSLGGLWAHRRQRKRVKSSLTALIGMLALTVVGFECCSDYLLKLPVPPRFIIGVLLLLPVGFLMGLPFPLGMRHILNNPVQRAYAWSVNGCASVLSSIVAAQVSVSFGIPVVAVGAMMFYLLAFVAIRTKSKPIE